MKNITLILAIALAMAEVFLPAKSSMQQSESAEVLLGAGLHQQEVEGDLDAAIATFRKVLTAYPDDRPIAARALLHIGECYEKLGKDEARKAYEQLIRDYADQSEQAKAAQARLAALQGTMEGAEKSAFAIRRILTDVADLSYAPSPDGRYLSFLDANTGNLAIHDLETGTNRSLTKEGSWGNPTQYVLSSRWSPDGKQIAYNWYNASGCLDLRAISRKGGMPRILIKCEGDSTVSTWMKTFDWSPDGRQILVFLSKEFLGTGEVTYQIVLVRAADGATKVVKTFKGRRGSLTGETTSGKDWPEIMCFSPDGRYIAYDRPPEGGAPEHDIFLMSIDGKHEAVLVKQPAHDRLFGWPHEGKGILYASNRTGSWDLWFLPVLEGNSHGAPQLIKRGIGPIAPLGFTQRGSFYYTQTMRSAGIYVATMDPETGRILSPPEKAIKRFEGSNRWPSYSHDGRYLAYVSTKMKNSDVLCLYSLRTGEMKEFPSEWNRIEGLSWSPDSRFIYFETAGDEGKAIYRVDIQNGEFSHVLTKPPDRITHYIVPSDGTGLILSRQTVKRDGWEIVYRDLANGRERQIYRSSSPRRIGTSLSPDGRQLALMSQDGVLKVMPVEGGEAREILRVRQFNPSAFPFIEWTADGKYILFRKDISTHNNPQTTLCRISVDGGDPEDLNLHMRFGPMSAHPDGQHLAFISPGFAEASPAIWIMENFLPGEGSASK